MEINSNRKANLPAVVKKLHGYSHERKMPKNKIKGATIRIADNVIQPQAAFTLPDKDNIPAIKLSIENGTPKMSKKNHFTLNVSMFSPWDT